MLQKAFENECLSRSNCHEWFKRFKEKQQDSFLFPKIKRPMKRESLTIYNLWTLKKKNHWRSVLPHKGSRYFEGDTV